MTSVPILGLAITEMATAVEGGASGYADTREAVLHGPHAPPDRRPGGGTGVVWRNARIAQAQFGSTASSPIGATRWPR